MVDGIDTMLLSWRHAPNNKMYVSHTFLLIARTCSERPSVRRSGAGTRRLCVDIGTGGGTTKIWLGLRVQLTPCQSREPSVSVSTACRFFPLDEI